MPKFTVIDEDGEEYAYFSNDAEDAALEHARKSNESGDYSLMNGSATIKVNGKEFLISAEPDIHYRAVQLATTEG